MKKSHLRKLFCLIISIIFSLQLSAQITLNLRAFLEGPFAATEMLNGLNVSGYIPLQQPYNTLPWNYNGGEQVVALPNANVVDWVLIELLQEEIIGGDITYTVQAREAAFILNNGDVKDLDGLSLLLFPGINLADFYVRILHRNHIPVVSSVTLTEVAGIYTYDFTTGAEQAMGDFDSQNELAPGIWGMISGDGNADFQVDNEDKDDIWISQEGFTGYQSADYNMDGLVDEADKIDKWEPNAGKGFNVPVTYPAPFECGNPLTDTRDGQEYSTVLIGAQCWMAENLNIGTMVQGSTEMTNDGIIEKYCYNNNTANCDVYGGLYQWYEMMQYVITPGVQGVCPADWHVPTDAEWCTLTQFIDPTVNCNITGWSGTDVGTKMKSTTGWAPGGNGTNTSGFTAVPGGGRFSTGIFSSLEYNGYFWTSTEGTGVAWSRTLSNSTANIGRSNGNKSFGYSVRCLMD